MRNVFSSHVNKVGYDEDALELTVEFSNGSVVVYHDVPPRTGRSVTSAPSIGQELWRSVRGRHEHHYERRARRK